MIINVSLFMIQISQVFVVMVINLFGVSIRRTVIRDNSDLVVNTT